MKSTEFLKELAELGQTLRANIEASCTGWDDDPDAIAERVAKVNDPACGFDYFVSNYFPHYIRHDSRSELHKYLFERLPAILQDPKSVKEAIAAPRGEAKSTIVSQMFTLYRLITQQTRYSVIVMETDTQACIMLEAIKSELEANPRLRIDFPKIFVKVVCGKQGLSSPAITSRWKWRVQVKKSVVVGMGRIALIW